MSGHRPHQSRSTGCVFISENKIPLQCNGVRRTRKGEGMMEEKGHSCTFVDFLCHAALKAMSEDSPVNTERTGVCRSARAESSFGVNQHPC